MAENKVVVSGCDKAESDSSSPMYLAPKIIDSDGNFEEAYCVIREFSGSSRLLKAELYMPADTNVTDFVHLVAKRFGFLPSSIQLIAPDHNRTARAIFVENTAGTLGDSGALDFGKGGRNLFVVDGFAGKLPLFIGISSPKSRKLAGCETPEEQHSPMSEESESPYSSLMGLDFLRID